MATENNEKYFYMRLKDNFFSSDEMIILEGMADGYLYSNILLKLYLKSLKNKGKLMLNDYIPYSSTMLAQLTGHNVGIVEKALGLFKELGLIEVLDNGTIYMLNIQSFIGKSSTEADRIRDYRERIKEEKNQLKAPRTDVQQMKQNQLPYKCTTELEIETELDIEIDKEKESTTDAAQGNNVTEDLPRKEERINYQKIVDMYNDTCVSFPRLRTLSENRKKAIKARLHQGYTYEDFEEAFVLAENSNFLKGGNDRNWSATFDWIMKDANLTKILEGNYNNKVATVKKEQSSGNPFLDRLRELGEI